MKRASLLAVGLAGCAQTPAPIAEVAVTPPIKSVRDPSAPPPEEILARTRALLEEEAYHALGIGVINEVRHAPAAVLMRRIQSLPRMIQQPDGTFKSEPAAIVAAVRSPNGWVRVTSAGRQPFDHSASFQLDRLLRGPELWAEPVIASGGCLDPSGTNVLLRHGGRERMTNFPCGMVGLSGEVAQIVLAGNIVDWTRVPAELRPTGLSLRRFDEMATYYQFSSGIDEPRRIDIRSPAEWEGQWARLTRRHGNPPPAPRIDFTREMILLAAMGQRPTGGYSVRIERVLPRSEEYQVFVRETSPGRRCGTTQASTSPVDIVVVPATPKPVRWVVEQDVHDCP